MSTPASRHCAARAAGKRHEGRDVRAKPRDARCRRLCAKAGRARAAPRVLSRALDAHAHRRRMARAASADRYHRRSTRSPRCATPRKRMATASSRSPGAEASRCADLLPIQRRASRRRSARWRSRPRTAFPFSATRSPDSIRKRCSTRARSRAICALRSCADRSAHRSRPKSRSPSTAADAQPRRNRRRRASSRGNERGPRSASRQRWRRRRERSRDRCRPDARGVEAAVRLLEVMRGAAAMRARARCSPRKVSRPFAPPSPAKVGFCELPSPARRKKPERSRSAASGLRDGSLALRRRAGLRSRRCDRAQSD